MSEAETINPGFHLSTEDAVADERVQDNSNGVFSGPFTEETGWVLNHLLGPCACDWKGDGSGGPEDQKMSRTAVGCSTFLHEVDLSLSATLSSSSDSKSVHFVSLLVLPLSPTPPPSAPKSNSSSTHPSTAMVKHQF
ncbi:hypothetical protein V6N12_072179 [Hibiscus sabdariffa]|uniref:Uncharacterized protein n=1 Tax=Hibiscus sabdariffa TaxID=183260 RepID=A0ABR2FMR4_9ROSI